ncbi:MAG TPA: DUF2804 domain-containing protein [Candidatus Goldiibacteriota bacterium]|nr:DUF2804 domain-containing protein [Candidatus Goldiibacteriota bacterium]
MAKLIDEKGRPVFGLHNGPLKELNFGDFKRRGGRGGLKRWVFAGVCSSDAVFGLAIAHLGYLSNLFAYVFDRKAGKIVSEADSIMPFAAGTVFEGTGLEGSAVFGKKAGITMTPYMLRLEAKISGGLSAELEYARIKESLNLVTRNGLEGFNYTCKEAGLGVSGKIRARGKEYVITPENSYGNFDYTYGVLKRSTFWNWASGGGADSKGRKLGFNFSQGVNETGFTENAFWVDGKMVKVDTVDFLYDTKNTMSGWRLKSFDNRVDLTFKPDGSRDKDFNIGIVKSFYRQPFGSFSGTLKDGPETYELADAYGFTEEHDAVW